MTNYLRLLDLDNAITKRFIPILDNDNKATVESEVNRKVNDQAVNAILAYVHESIAPIFGEAINVNDMWLALLQKYEGNELLKRSKEDGLTSKFDNFRIEDNESIDDMYSRLTCLLNDLIEVGEPIPQRKVISKLLNIMMRRKKWQGYISSLQALHNTRERPFTTEEVYSFLKTYEETLRQLGGDEGKGGKVVAFAAQNQRQYNPSSSSSNQRPFNSSSNSSSLDTWFQSFGVDNSKEIPILSKMMQGFFAFEKRFNARRDEDGKRIVCFFCEKEGHTIHQCFRLFPHLKSQDGIEKQEQK